MQRGGDSSRPMSDTRASTGQRHEPDVYAIRVQGHLDGRWADWFDGLTITLEDNGDSLLLGAVADQAALHGLLRKVRDLGLPLVSVVRVEAEQAKETRL